MLWCISGVDAHTLRLRVQPGRALGGEAFEEQPQVEIMEGDGGDVDVLFQVSLCTSTKQQVVLVLCSVGPNASAVSDALFRCLA